MMLDSSGYRMGVMRPKPVYDLTSPAFVFLLVISAPVWIPIYIIAFVIDWLMGAHNG